MTGAASSSIPSNGRAPHETLRDGEWLTVGLAASGDSVRSGFRPIERSKVRNVANIRIMAIAEYDADPEQGPEGVRQAGTERHGE